jgi:nucleoside 2-deoxyribosyltransferase
MPVKGYLRMIHRSHLYVAGPIGSDPEKMKENAKKAIVVGNDLRDLGFNVFIPHLGVWWQELYPRHLEDWMSHDFAWIKRCDAVFRISGHSPGSDREVAFAQEQGIPVFFDVPALLLWARK